MIRTFLNRPPSPVPGSLMGQDLVNVGSSSAPSWLLATSCPLTPQVRTPRSPSIKFQHIEFHLSLVSRKLNLKPYAFSLKGLLPLTHNTSHEAGNQLGECVLSTGRKASPMMGGFGTLTRRGFCQDLLPETPLSLRKLHV